MIPAPTLTTERLSLRRPDARDWPAFRDFMLSPRASFFGIDTEAKAFRQFAAELGHWDIYGHGMWTVTLQGTDAAIGLVGPWTPPDWPENEIGWMIYPASAEGKGYAFEAARAAIAHAYGVLHWDTVVSYVAPDNIRSAKLAEKLGAVIDDKAAPPASCKGYLVFRHPRPQTKGGAA
ncbi:acetyltransferase, GNAT family protein [Ketogulonicigenium robustum]|uniref:Acetyltransferase, GNAT family protein n=1 Tax=Ketogulonicigenium robustum TaxID=92947 RepID=A0A1W6NW81_9RHOB|nr:GNAT family N-acetyltransferase [Ketogulonicigenium robustum]ARO13461.1 acetyltransferase, GNAT family protein [Ketogulonicigenium robustum]